MTTCDRTHATIDDLITCPPCDAFLTDNGPLYTVYALWEGAVSADIYDGDDYDNAASAFDAYLETAEPGESVHLYEPHYGNMIAETTVL